MRLAGKHTSLWFPGSAWEPAVLEAPPPFGRRADFALGPRSEEQAEPARQLVPRPSLGTRGKRQAGKPDLLVEHELLGVQQRPDDVLVPQLLVRGVLGQHLQRQLPLLLGRLA